ncbi:MAG: hypothetical protein L0229_01890 [Blastocatellia bacterium]|nr:hypothetical protein [Blastocatellia bacterium]
MRELGFVIVPMLLAGALQSSIAGNALCQDEQSKKDRFVRAVERVVAALDAEDYSKFESLIDKGVTSISAQELWPAARGILAKFGKVQKVEFSEFDGDGAFVKVQFERAKREVYVRLNDQDKFIELTYVPPGHSS